MKISIVLLILVLYFNACSKDNDNIIKYHELDVKNQIIIEEDKETIYTSITQIEYSPDGGKILICDARGNTVSMYNKNTGKKIRSFIADVRFSDSVALYDIYYQKEHKYLTFSEIKKNTADEISDEIISHAINDLKSAIFLNDSIIVVAGHFRSFAVPYSMNLNNITVENVKYSLSNGLIFYNLNLRSEDFVPVSFYNDIFFSANLYGFDKDKEEIILSCWNIPAWKRSVDDSVFAVASIDLKGNFRQIILNLHEDLIRSKIYYRLYYKPSLYINSNNILCTFPFVEEVLNLSKHTSFPLVDLPFSNELVYDSLEKEQITYNERMKNYQPMFPNHIKNVYELNNGNILVIILHVDANVKPINQYYIIQTYTPDGELLDHKNIQQKNEFGSIQHISFDKYDNQLLIFRKSDVWIMQFAEVD